MDVTKIKGLPFHIASAIFAIPKTKEEQINFSRYIKYYKIDTLINVSDYSIPEKILNFYKLCGIKRVVYGPFDDRILTPEEYPKFLKSIKIIYNNLKNEPYKNILVHCSAGINRSATIIAYMVWKTTDLDMKSIIERIRDSNKNRDRDALTNYTFVELLNRIEEKNPK